MDEYMDKLIKNKIVDARLYYFSTYYKLDSAKMNFRIMNRFIDNVKVKCEKDLIKDIEKSIETNCKIVKSIEWNDLIPQVDYCGEKVDIDIVLNKLFFETVSLLHSFFDNYSQWINITIFGGKALNESIVSIKKICGVINEDESIKQHLPFVISVISNENFKFIDKLNNIIKHRYQVFTKSRFGFINGIVNQSIEVYDDDTKHLYKKNCLLVLEECIKYCEQLFTNYFEFSSAFLDSPPVNFKESVNNRLNLMISDNEIIIENLRLGDYIFVLPLNNYIFVEPPIEIGFKCSTSESKCGLLRKVDSKMFNKHSPRYFKYEVII